MTDGRMPRLATRGFYKIDDVAQREKPGRRKWLVVVEMDSQFVEWTRHQFYGRTRERAVAKAERWIGRENSKIWRSEDIYDGDG